jgi:hypothetical protein
MSFGSNGEDWVRSLRKNPTQLRLADTIEDWLRSLRKNPTQLRLADTIGNGPNSAHFAPIFVQ